MLPLKKSFPALSRSYTPLQRDILRTVLYFDCFNHPLKAEEIHAFLPSDSTDAGEIGAACRADPLREMIRQRDGYFLLASSSPSVVDSRLEKERRAAKFWKIARFMTVILKRMPFVRAVAISGELSKGLASEGADIDFVIITARRRLWICRTILVLFKRTLLLGSKKFFCINHIVSEDHLRFDERNIYAAVEIATLKPMHNDAMFHDYMEANRWVSGFLPNAPWPPVGGQPKKELPSWIQKFLELPFSLSISDRLDARLLSIWKSIWKRRFPSIPEAQRERLFQCTEFISTAYRRDFLMEFLKTYRTRLESFGVSEGGVP